MAIQSAIEDFTKAVEEVRRGGAALTEIYRFEVQAGREKIGNATFEFTQGAPPTPLVPITQSLKARIESLMGPIEEIDIDPEEPVNENGER